MKQIMRSSLKFAVLFILLVGLLGSGLRQENAAAAPLKDAVPLDLYAVTGTADLLGGSVPVWAYTTDGSAAIQPGGPTIFVNQGDVVTITLYNNLSERTALMVNGQAMIPDTTGVAPEESKPYTFTASQPGTFLYQASPLLPGGSAHQVAMGLYGALVVRPSGATGQAYASPSTAFDKEAVLVLSELDPALNTSATPALFDLRNYHPTYFLINGQAYPDTASIPAAAGDTVLLRFVNAGLQAHSMSLLGLAQRAIAVDGRPFSHARRLTADTIFSGQTSDVLVNMPANLQGVHQYAIFDAGFVLSSNSGSFGGMLTFLKMDTGIAVDNVGPATSGVSLSPDKVGGASPASVALSATVSDALSGGSSIQAAEYYIDSTAGTGTPMTLTAGPGASDASASETINPSGLSHGSHTIFVRGQDAAGNWGTFGTAVLTVDKAGPAIFSLELVPNPSDGSSVLLHVTADDRATGDSEIASVTYTVAGGSPVTLTPETTAASTFYFTDVLAASVGTHKIEVSAADKWGNVGATASIDMVVDKTGPVTSAVVPDPTTTNGVNIQKNASIAAVRVEASFSDTTSNISKAEGFLTPKNASGTGICQVITPGANGSGIVFVATDGLFDSQSETGYIDIPLAQFWILKQTCGTGLYTVHVHAQDASGNWGGFSTTDVNVTP